MMPQATQRQADRWIGGRQLLASDHRSAEDLNREVDRDSLLAVHPAMERTENNNASDSTMARCLLCTSNDDQALIEHLAERLWDSRMDYFEERTSWADAGPTWQHSFRELAIAARQALAQ